MCFLLRQSACFDDNNSSRYYSKGIMYPSPRKAIPTQIADLSVSMLRYKIKSDFNSRLMSTGLKAVTRVGWSSLPGRRHIEQTLAGRSPNSKLQILE